METVFSSFFTKANWLALSKYKSVGFTPYRLFSPQCGNMSGELNLPSLAVHSLARFVDDQRHWFVRQLWGQHLMMRQSCNSDEEKATNIRKVKLIISSLTTWLSLLAMEAWSAASC